MSIRQVVKRIKIVFKIKPETAWKMKVAMDCWIPLKRSFAWALVLDCQLYAILDVCHACLVILDDVTVRIYVWKQVMKIVGSIQMHAGACYLRIYK